MPEDILNKIPKDMPDKIPKKIFYKITENLLILKYMMEIIRKKII